MDLPIAVMGKARPRWDSRRGRTHMPAPYLAWRRDAVLLIRRLWQGEPMTTPVRLGVELVHPRPGGKPQTLIPRELWASGERIRATRSPDIDNAVGAVMDAMTDARVWVDDRLVVELHASQWWGAKGERAHVVVVVDEVGFAGQRAQGRE